MCNKHRQNEDQPLVAVIALDRNQRSHADPVNTRGVVGMMQHDTRRREVQEATSSWSKDTRKMRIRGRLGGHCSNIRLRKGISVHRVFSEFCIYCL